jgi:hypothetical protein
MFVSEGIYVTRRGAACTVSENQKPEDQKKKWIAKLGSKWAQALIATLIGLSITVPLTFFWGEGTKMVKAWYAERQNMSYEDALAEAKENVGASTVDVIPFRNADSSQQFIAVITNPPKSETPPKNPYSTSSKEGSEFFLGEETMCAYTHPSPQHQCYPIKILRKIEGASSEVADPGLAAYDTVFDRDKYVDGKLIGDFTPEQDYRNSLLGVVDIDEDGNKEVYSMYRSVPGAGSRAYVIKIKLYDSLTEDVYELRGSAEPSSTTANLHYVDKRPKEEFSKWMNQKADTLILFDQGASTRDQEWDQLTEKERHSKEVRDWIRDNGVGFDEGPLTLKEHEGQVPESGSSSCTINDGVFEWRPFFKGALFGYDKARDTHYVVWVPESNYDMVSPSMVAGKQYLWVDMIKDDGLIVFNKETQALEVVSVPELKGTPTPSSPKNYAHAGLLVQGSSLYRRLGTQDQQPISLTLPDTIDAEEEFENAAGCSAQGRPPVNLVK